MQYSKQEKLFLKDVRQYAKKYMGLVPAHDFSHAERVAKYAAKIAAIEFPEDTYISEIAGWLHDVGLCSIDRSKHGIMGGMMVKEFLETNPKAKFLSDIAKSNIVEAITWHNNFFEIKNPSKTLIAVVEADTLDLLGAVGIWRGIVARKDSTMPSWRDIIISLSTKFPDYDKIYRENREKNLHSPAEQINFQIECAQIIKTKTGQKMAESLISTMKRFRYMLLNELTKY